MKHRVENYYFDPDRMILYEANVKQEDEEKILSFFPVTSNYYQELKNLKNGIKEQKSMAGRGIRSAGIALTFNCGLRCNYCSQSSCEGMSEYLSISDVAAFIQDIIKKRIITSLVERSKPSLSMYFTGGGEPTYNWSLFTQAVEEVERQCAENGVQLTLAMTTNGMLNSVQREFVIKHFDKVLLSYDGMPCMQNQNRRTASNKSTNAVVCDTINAFVAGNIDVTIRSTVWQHDFQYLHSMCEFINSVFKGISAWDINPVTPAGRAEAVMRSKYGSLSSTDFLEAFLNVHKENVPFRITTPLLSNSTTGFSCGGIGPTVSGLWLLPNRKITTCIDSSDIITQVGCIIDGEVVYFDRFEDPLLEMGIKKYIECKDCIAFCVCGSGCPLKHIREEHAHTEMVPWECSMQRKFWRYILEEIVGGNESWGWKGVHPTDQLDLCADVLVLTQAN